MPEFIQTDLLYAGVFNPGKRLDHVVANFTCLHHKSNIPLEAGIYKDLSEPQQAVLVLGKFHNRMGIGKLLEHLPLMKSIFLHPEIEQRQHLPADG